MALALVVPWELFHPKLHAAVAAQDLCTPPTKRKSAAGRKPCDGVPIVKALAVQELYNLSDKQAVYQLRDWLTFIPFLGPGLENAMPYATTLWLCREALAQAGAVKEFFTAFESYHRKRGRDAS